MEYDRLGFPIPKEFETAVGRTASSGCRPPAGLDRGERDPAVPGPWRRYFLVAVLLFGVLPVLLLPKLLPWLRGEIIERAKRQAMIDEGRADVAAAARNVGHALDWVDDDPGQQGELLCWRSTLRLQNGDVQGAIADATTAAVVVPRSSMPLKTRALAHVVAGDAAAALADAEAAVAIDGDDNPESLNHRAYIRALVARDLPAALADIERALEGGGAETPAYLDTRGYILHLLGRHHDAIDDLNRAIVLTREQRRGRLQGLRGADPLVTAVFLRPFEHALAVMHQHRALACRAAGLAAQAEQDFEIARSKGFAPDRGVL